MKYLYHQQYHMPCFSAFGASKPSALKGRDDFGRIRPKVFVLLGWCLTKGMLLLLLLLLLRLLVLRLLLLLLCCRGKCDDQSFPQQQFMPSPCVRLFQGFRNSYTLNPKPSEQGLDSISCVCVFGPCSQAGLRREKLSRHGLP